CANDEEKKESSDHSTSSPPPAEKDPGANIGGQQNTEESLPKESGANADEDKEVAEGTEADDFGVDVDEVMDKMSVTEKIGQLVFMWITGTSVNEHTKALINEHKVGGIIFYADNLETPEQTVHLLNEIKAENKGNRLPLLLGVDQEGGRVSRLPGEIH